MFEKNNGLDIRWSKIKSNADLWEATGQKPIIVRIRKRKWRLVGRTVRKWDDSIKKKTSIGLESEGSQKEW